MLGGLFAYAIGQWEVQPGLHLYQYIYITYGAFTTGWGIMLFFALPDSPVTAWFLNHEERLAAVARVQQNQTGMINRHFKRDQVIEAILDPKTWFFFVFGFVSNIVNGGLNAFSTAIINGFGFSTFYKSFFGHSHLFINFNAFLCLSDCFFQMHWTRLFSRFHGASSRRFLTSSSAFASRTPLASVSYSCRLSYSYPW